MQGIFKEISEASLVNFLKESQLSGLKNPKQSLDLDGFLMELPQESLESFQVKVRNEYLNNMLKLKKAQ